MSKNIKLSSPWIIFYHELTELFADDSDVEVTITKDDDGLNVIKLLVNGQTKANALNEINTVTVLRSYI